VGKKNIFADILSMNVLLGMSADKESVDECGMDELCLLMRK